MKVRKSPTTRLSMQIRASVTSKGQVTIPAVVRRAMSIGAGDKILFQLDEDGSVTIRRPRYSTVASLAGAAGSLPPGRTFDDERVGEYVTGASAAAYRRKVAREDA